MEEDNYASLDRFAGGCVVRVGGRRLCCTVPELSGKAGTARDSFAPGGATDIIARTLEPKLTRRLGQQSSSTTARARPQIAVEIVAQAQPDGTRCWSGTFHQLDQSAAVREEMKVNAVKDLAGVTKLVAIPNFILGSPKMPANT